MKRIARRTTRTFRESSDATLKDIERTYGAKTAKALVKYCELKKLDIDKVVYDTKEDGNGMTPWDMFDKWANRVLKLDIMGNFDDTIDWTGAEDETKKPKKLSRGNITKRDGDSTGKRFGKVYQAPTDFKTMEESSGSRMSDTDIVNWIGEELEECEWVDDISYSDDIGLKSAQVAIKVRDKVFIVSVEEDAGAAKQLLGWNEDEI